MRDNLSAILLLLFVTFSLLIFVTGEQTTQNKDTTTPELCVPHSPKINCSYLPLEFLECQGLTDHQGNNTAREDAGHGCVKFGGQRFEDVEITKVYCTVLQGIECCGEREFLRDGFPCIKYSGHYFVTTLIYSVLLGFLGMDRFCLGHTGTAVGKLLTLGGVGIWWVVDIVLLITGSLTPEDGSNWNPYV
ncbi:hypothetical protein O3P69_009445 [Scylla paramamosain]|uniref:TM2 domain-containing protein n=1 Tax=Scylla paramamosain TaxID=85552 RepID=A0AAW0SV92_SCYPA